MLLRIFVCAIVQACILGYVFGVVPQITRLNVQCDRTGMKVNVEFDNAFNGIVFSKGHYSDPNCRYVKESSNRRQFNFFISSSGCGTLGTDMTASNPAPQGFKNVIIIQNDPNYQEMWDSARKLSCDWVTRLEKYVTFAPFGVDMLGVKELRFPGDTVDCWMDIQRGHGPFASPISGVVPIGEKLTVAIYVRDTDKSFDVHVKDCYAYDMADYRNPDARAIKLTDEKGCPVKEKLVQGFFRTRDVRNSGASIIAYGIINAFKFPERMDVYLACNVEVCKGTCPDNTCQPEVSVAGEDSAVNGMTTSTAAPTDSQDDESGESEDKPEEASSTAATTDAEEDKETEDEEDAGKGTATEETESSEDTSESTPKKDEEAEEESEDEKKEEDGMVKDEEKADEEDSDKKDTETTKKDDEDEEEEDTEKKDEEKTDTETKEDEEKKDTDEQTKSDDEDEEKKKKAARISVKVKKPKSKRSKSAKVTPKRSTKVSSSKPKSKAKSARVASKTLKKRSKTQSRLSASTTYELARKKKSARIVRAPSSIPDAFLKRRAGSAKSRHVRTRRSIEAPEQNATFPAMMHSFSIISPIEDFDDQELEAWEKMMKLEGNVVEEEMHKQYQHKHPTAPYCFSFVGLVSSSALLSSLVLICTLALHLVATHLAQRSHTVQAKLEC